MGDWDVSILVFGRQTKIKKIVDYLQKENLQVLNIPEGCANSVNLSKIENISLAILDCCADEFEKMNKRISNIGTIPIVLVMTNDYEIWHRVQTMDVIGYLPDNISMIESTARLRAILRNNVDYMQNKKHLTFSGTNNHK